MEAMDKRKKDRLIKGIVLNIAVLLGCVTYIFVSVMPQYSEMNIVTAKINDTISKITSLKNDGVNSVSFTELLTRLGKKKEVPDIVFSDSEKLNKVLLKPSSAGKKEYLAWLIEENGKVNNLDKEIQENDRILGNIIPIFINPSTVISGTDVANQITLSSFIDYIEKDILGKYSLLSYAPLGIANIVFPDKKDTPINIGSFKITLDFKGKNSNILSLVDSLQKSGKLTIRNGKLISEDPVSKVSLKDKGLATLSNLLIGINSFALDTVPSVLSDDNNGSMTLEFFVEGMNYQKILTLQSILLAKFEGLQKSVKEKGLLCSKTGNPLCTETATANAIATIKGLTKNLVVLQPKLDAFKKGDITIDVNKEIDSLFEIKSSLQNIEMIYLKNNSILEKAKKPNSTNK